MKKYLFIFFIGVFSVTNVFAMGPAEAPELPDLGAGGSSSSNTTDNSGSAKSESKFKSTVSKVAGKVRGKVSDVKADIQERRNARKQENQNTNDSSLDLAGKDFVDKIIEITQKTEFADVPQEEKDKAIAEARAHAKENSSVYGDNSGSNGGSNSGSDDSQNNNNESGKSNETNVTAADVEAAREKYEAAKEKEQSLANRTVTSLSTAAMGIGAMELARGLSEQKADKDADADMDAYIETMRCSYGDGKSVKAGPEEIILPGGNDGKIMSYRSEYFALAKDLKERKTALGMKPGIESEEILDKTQMGLYDDEFKGIEKGSEASLYRAKMLGSETDQAKLDEMQEASSKRVKGGAIAAAAGVVAGVAGNLLINGNGDNKKNIGNDDRTDDEKVCDFYKNLIEDGQSHSDIVKMWSECSDCDTKCK